MAENRKFLELEISIVLFMAILMHGCLSKPETKIIVEQTKVCQSQEPALPEPPKDGGRDE